MRQIEQVGVHSEEIKSTDMGKEQDIKKIGKIRGSGFFSKIKSKMPSIKKSNIFNESGKHADQDKIEIGKQADN